MTMPTSQCPWRMQVHHIHQETPDVWTLSLLCHDYYPYRAGQYALVSVRNSAETLRAYTLSSTPGVSEYITLTVRRIDEGTGSQWLTREVKRGDYLGCPMRWASLPATIKRKINSCCWPPVAA
ncbi:NADH oxidoreductase hcr [Klebsiella pneumoniae]|uniref:NADH oxidoreductase hcr n=1 Tax=Klebsiella pneumoniae TaxID=573 RepID=A0A2X1R0T2_KLEPN|nr:NADH oxidoreductase hcr [Klebsiella pneumoniae]